MTPAADKLVNLLAAVSEDQFDLPTPCPDARVGDLIDHIGTFASGFIAVAHKDGRGRPSPPDVTNLEAGWRDRIAHDLRACADAWQAPEAWEGMTAAGGIDLPGEVAGLVALDELVVHGWDLAMSTRQPYEPSVPDIEASMSFIEAFDAPRDGTLFGPVVPVPESAAPLDRLLGLTGRDPSWQPPTV